MLNNGDAVGSAESLGSTTEGDANSNEEQQQTQQQDSTIKAEAVEVGVEYYWLDNGEQQARDAAVQTDPSGCFCAELLKAQAEVRTWTDDFHSRGTDGGEVLQQATAAFSVELAAAAVGAAPAGEHAAAAEALALQHSAAEADIAAGSTAECVASPGAAVCMPDAGCCGAEFGLDSVPISGESGGEEAVRKHLAVGCELGELDLVQDVGEADLGGQCAEGSAAVPRRARWADASGDDGGSLPVVPQATVRTAAAASRRYRKTRKRDAARRRSAAAAVPGGALVADGRGEVVHVFQAESSGEALDADGRASESAFGDEGPAVSVAAAAAVDFMNLHSMDDVMIGAVVLLGQSLHGDGEFLLGFHVVQDCLLEARTGIQAAREAGLSAAVAGALLEHINLQMSLKASWRVS
jgi:hypothetical protein